MDFQTAVEKFVRANERDAIPNRKDGGTHSISTSRQQVVVSAARRALHRATDSADVGSVDIDPYAETLADHAYRYAEEEGLANPAGYRSRVRLFLLVVEGKEYTYQRSGENRILPEWRKLFTALDRLVDEDDYHPSLRPALLRLQHLACLNGVRAPRNLPGRRTLDEWAEAQKDAICERYRRRGYRAFQLARGELGADNLPTLEVLVHSNERGPRTLENLTELLEDAGFDGNPYELTGAEIVRIAAPKLSKAVTRYLGSSSGSSSAFEKKLWNVAGRLLAEAVRLGYSPAEFSFYKAFDPTEEVETEPDDLLDECPLESTVGHVAPIERILDEWATASWENSPLYLDRDSSRDQGPRFAYTESVQHDLRICFQVLNSVYGKRLRQSNPHKWRDLRGVYLELKAEIRDHNDGCRILGQKDKERILDAVTWPQLVCIGLPTLRRRVVRLRGRYFAAFHEHGSRDCPAVHRARTAYHKWLTRYLITALIADDGLRIKNYTGALVGTHIIPTVTTEVDDDGHTRWSAITRIETRFRGYDDDFASLKTKENENQRERKRERFLLPGIVDHELLLDYWLDVRPYNLQRAGLIDDEGEFDPQTDRDGYALFISPQAANKDGRYTTDKLSTVTGKALHWICREVLGREVPDWDSDERTSAWRGLFSAHVIRLMIGTYWGGLREEWSYAMRLTDDNRKTLEDSYDEGAGDAMQKKMMLDGWENPHYFDDVLDRVRDGERIDWNALRRDRGLP